MSLVLVGIGEECALDSALTGLDDHFRCGGFSEGLSVMFESLLSTFGLFSADDGALFLEGVLGKEVVDVSVSVPVPRRDDDGLVEELVDARHEVLGSAGS